MQKTAGQKMINQAIKELREGLQLSQQVFATNLGIAMTSLLHYEKARREPPVETLLQLASLAQQAGNRELAFFFGFRASDKLAAAIKNMPLTLSAMNHESGKGMMILTIDGMQQWNYAENIAAGFIALRNGDERDRHRAERAFEALRKHLGPKWGLPPQSGATEPQKRKAS